MVLVRALAALVALRTASARTVEWHGIDATIKGRSLLRSISGRAEPGRLHAIMGPSGSGKSTLLCAIAGCCDRKVGLRGPRVSGGERKRLAIACELVDDPAVLFLDEPTSGLDSFAAARVVASLRGLCDAGTTVVCVIHQPSGKVFDAFDDLTLLSEGELMYHGPRRGVDRALARQGAKRPAFSSAAEHAVAAVSVDYSSAETEAASRGARAPAAAARAAAPAAPPPAETAPAAATPAPGRRGGLASSASTSARRDVARQGRDGDQGRAAGHDGADLRRHLRPRRLAAVDPGPLRLLSLCAIGSTNLAIASTIRAFPEKAIVVRERAPRSGRPMYGAFPYLASKVAAELPLAAGLSCLFGAVLYPLAKLRRSAQAFRTFLGIQSTPKPIKFLPAVLVRWGFEGLAVNEFDGLYFECQNRREDLRTGRDALARLAFEDSTVKKACVAQAAILGGCYLQTYRALRSSRPAFAVMKPTRR
ncbi:ATPase [Aureococcus anophagefferens]|nr:ATPase [Aureococcus anophagefferens]